MNNINKKLFKPVVFVLLLFVLANVEQSHAAQGSEPQEERTKRLTSKLVTRACLGDTDPDKENGQGKKAVDLVPEDLKDGSQRLITGGEDLYQFIKHGKYPVKIVEQNLAMQKKINKFVKAAAEGDLDKVKKLLAQGVDVNGVSDGAWSGYSALYAAVMLWKMDVAEVLLEQKGVKVDGRNKLGITPLMIACQQGCNARIIRLFKKAGADINAQNKQGSIALHFAAVYEDGSFCSSVGALLKAGADPHIKNYLDQTVFDVVPAKFEKEFQALVDQAVRQTNKDSMFIGEMCSFMPTDFTLTMSF